MVTRRNEGSQVKGEEEEEGEVDSLLSREPALGLDPRTWRS